MDDSTRARPEAKEEEAALEERIASTEERIARQERMFTALHLSR